MSNIVTFEQAVRLKEIGFDKQANYYYLNESLLHRLGYIGFNDSSCSNMFSAPTVYEALDYLREEKGDSRIKFYVECHYSCALRNVVYQGVITNDAALIIRSRTEEYLTHHLASSALLTAVLDYLEKKGGEE